MSDEEKDTKLLRALEAGKFRDIPDRGIKEEVCHKYGVRTIQKNGVIDKHLYPYFNQKGDKVAVKVRVVPTKEFFVEGRMKDCQLFGQQLFPSAGKYITITEGEVDCLSVYQMFGCKYPVVSIPNGATSKKAIQDNYEWLNGFDKIVLCFDGDKVGKASVIETAQMLPPDKVRIVKMPEDLKDANEFLKAGKTTEFVDLWYKAEEYRPEDIVNIGDMFDRLADYRRKHTYTPTPWEGVNEMISGTRPGQLVILASGTGMGKSAFLKTWMYNFINISTEKIGALFLEENPEDTVISLMSLSAGKNLKRPEVWDAEKQEDLKKYFDSCCVDRRIELFQPVKSTAPDYITEKIRYLAAGRKCKIIFFDHLTYVVDDSDDVRRDLNRLCKNLHDLCVSLGITVIAACHLRKATNGSKTHEEGGRVTLDDLKDSSSIKQLSDVIIGLERNAQDENVVKANTTLMRVLKNRDFGDKGVATAVLYDKATTKLEEVSLEMLQDVEDL